MAVSRYAIRRDRAETLTFSTLRRRYSLPIHDAQALRLDDVELTCFGQPNFDPMISAELFTGPDDVRWYLNDVDVTSALLEELRSRVAAVPAARLQSQYLEGVEYYLALLVDAAVGVDVSALREQARELAKRGLANLLTKFCDRTVGWSGVLHPAFYVYSAIPLEPLSLSAVWQRHLNISKSASPKELRDIPLVHLLVCQRWSPKGGVDKTTGPPLGVVRCSISSLYENPLRKPIEEFAQRLKQLDVQLEELRVSYLGPAQDALSEAGIEAKAGLSACLSAIGDVREMIGKIRP